METRRYDAIIIGSGQAGNPLAQAFADKQKKVALIERSHVGGTCINEGCTPTKTMYNSARVAYLAKRAEVYGVKTGSVSVDMAAVRKRKQSIVDEFRNSSQKRLEENEFIDLIWGEARFDNDKTIVVDTEKGKISLTADNIFINTGARAVKPSIPGLETVPTLDYVSIMELDEVPEHLLIMGGGYIGVEFGQMFRRFGSEVTIIQKGEKLLAREDADVADELAKILQEDGIEILFNAEALAANFQDVIELKVSVNGKEQTLCGSHLLIATGRKPNTESLNLQAAGIETTEREHIKTNGKLETNVPGIYALGDVKGGPEFTHISYDDYRIIKTNLLEGGSREIDHRMLPYTVFTDPQLGRIGLSEKEANEKGINYQIAKMPIEHVARAIEMSETRGFIKALLDPDSKQILGAAVLGVEGGEIMAMLQIAMMGQAPYTALRDGIFAHPTFAELFNNLFADFE